MQIRVAMAVEEAYEPPTSTGISLGESLPFLKGISQGVGC